MQKHDSMTVPFLPELPPQLGGICRRFEIAWRNADSIESAPSISDFLDDVRDDDRLQLLCALIAIDIAYRHRHGEEPTPDWYVDRFPELDEKKLSDLFADPNEKAPAPGTNDTSKDSTKKRTKRFRCPHCQNPVQLADNRSDEVVCPGCGSGFRVHDTHETSTESGMRQLGKFQLLERVGLGSFGAVWYARDTELDRLVALKIPHSALVSKSDDLERFNREARAAAQLRHPGIVTVHEVAVLEDLPVIVSDFIKGITLRDFLKIRRPTFQEAAELTAQLADALDYAHSLKIVHRDIKPSNIMLESSVVGCPSSVAEDSDTTDHGQPTTGYQPLLMDFGLALREEAEITITVDGQIIGTPAYMSPEQAAGKSHKVDRRSDIYSLGVVLYEMLAGELPFRGSKQMIVHQVLHEEPRAPRKVNDKIPRDLDTICLKALAKSPARRYATAREFAEDLRRFLLGEAVLARPVGTMEKVSKWVKRRPLVAGLLASVVAVTLVGIVVFAWAFGETIIARNDAIAKRKTAEEAEKKTAKALKETQAARAKTAKALKETSIRSCVADRQVSWSNGGGARRCRRGRKMKNLPDRRSCEGDDFIA